MVFYTSLSIFMCGVISTFFQTSLQQGTTPASKCSFTWTATAESHALGFIETGMRGSVTEGDCLKDCEMKSYCKAVDYNTYDRSCFYGNVSNAALRSSSVINHWELARNCSIQNSTSQCQVSWKRKENSHALGLTQIGQSAQYTLNECLSACEENASCRSVDYNLQDRTCFHGTQANPPTQAVNSVDHYDIQRVCFTEQDSTSTPLPTTSPRNTTALRIEEECRTSYVHYNNRVSLNGVHITSISNSRKCLDTCTNTALCVGLEMKLLSNDDIECWLHFDLKDFEKVYAAENHLQIILKRCPEEDVYQCQADFVVTYVDRFSPGGVLRSGANTLEMCKQACQDSAPQCRGFDFYTDSRCMLHSGDTLGVNLQSFSGVRQYRLEKACSGVCFPKWKTYMNTIGSGAKLVNLNISSSSIAACLQFCIRNINCIGIEYTDIKASTPFCSYFEATQRSGMENRTTKAWTVQYELEDRCHNQCFTNLTYNENGFIELINPTQVFSKYSEDCKTLCELDPSCRAFQINKVGGQQNCSIAKSWIDGITYANFRYDSGTRKYTNCSNQQPSLPPTPYAGSSRSSSSNGSTQSSPGSTFSGTSTTTGSCTKAWIKFEGKHTLGLSRLGSNGQFTEDQCRAECEKLNSTGPPCNVTDYNTLDKSCYVGAQNVLPSNLRTNSVINHWELQAGCSSATSGQSSTTSRSSTAQSTTTVSTRSSSSSPSSSTVATTSTSVPSTTAIPSATTSPGCQAAWSKVQGRNSPGLQQYGAANDYNEDQCRATCELYFTCNIVDYNTADRTCYHGSNPDHYTLENSAVNHWILLERCPGQCNITVSLNAGMLAPGLKQFGVRGQFTETKCKDACAADRLCYNCDYNRQDQTCFLGYQLNPATAINSVVNHYSFKRENC